MGDGFNRLALVLVILFLLAAVGVANASQLVYPWKNQSWVSSNPNILSYGGEYWWNLPEFDRTLASLQSHQTQFQSIGQSQSLAAAPKNIRQMLLLSTGNATLASKHEYLCVLNLLAGLGAFPVSPSYVFVAAFSSNSNCVAYKTSWKYAVSNSLDALDESMRLANKELQIANATYSKLLFSGICDKTYVGSGSEHCAELSAAFAIIGNAGGAGSSGSTGNGSYGAPVTEGKYGKFALVRTYYKTISINLHDPVPDISIMNPTLDLIWGNGGVIAAFHSLESLSNASIASAKAEYAYKLKSAEVHNLAAIEALSKLSGTKVWKIKTSPKTNELQHPGSVAERALILGKARSKLDQQFADAKLRYLNTGKRGYLSDSLKLLSEADAGYFDMYSEGQMLLDDAANAVSGEREDAESEIAATNSWMGGIVASSEARLLYDKATKALADGNSIIVLGDRFERYHQAASFARAARSSGTYENDSAALTSLASLRSLIQRAEKDGIDVTSEKESLLLLENYAGTSSPVYGPMEIDIANLLTDSIISKARAKYGYSLAMKRASILQRLQLAGAGAADLYTDLDRYEFGLVSDGSTVIGTNFGTTALLFPDAIGSLHKLNDNYDLLSKTLDGYSREIAGNAMATSVKPLVTNVSLDAPATVTLDIVLHSPYQFNASDVTVPVTTYTGVQFDYSDIVLGQESVKSITQEMTDEKSGFGTLLVGLHSVAPFEVKRIKMEKTAVVAHTISKMASAEGIGNGIAHVTEQTAFMLDVPVSIAAFHLPQDVLVDGAQSPSNYQYQAGKHTLLSDRLVDGAYTESESAIAVHPFGTNSVVEYTINILPNMDLDSVPLAIDSVNNSQISSFKITSTKGTIVKDIVRTSNTQVVAQLVGLKKNKPVAVHVSYSVENTQAFVLSQLSMFGSPSTQYLEQAKSQASSGNYSTALEFIEKHKAELRSIESKSEKQQAVLGSKRQLAASELESISSLLGRLPVSSSLSAKLSERKTVLELALQNDSKLVDLNNNWLDDELQVFRKDSSTEVNNLKVRFYNNNADNQTLPDAFSAFDSTANKFDAGGGADSIPAMAAALTDAKYAVELDENATKGRFDSLKSIVASFKQPFTSLSKHYFDEAKSAKGTNYAGEFTITEKEVQTLLSSVQAAKDERIFLMRMAELNMTSAKMVDTLESLSKEANARISLLEVQISKLQGDPQSSTLSSAVAKLSQVKSLASGGKFIAALSAASALSKELDSAVPTQNNTSMTVLGITAFALLGGVVFYLSKAPKQKHLKPLGTFPPVSHDSKRENQFEKHL